MTNQTRADGRGLAKLELNGSSADPQNIDQPPATQARAKRRSPYRDAAIKTLLTLRQRFPQAIARLDLPNRQPLKIAIHLDLIAALPELPAVDIKRALKLYTGDIKYLASCTEGKHRVDFSGQPAGAVTAEEAAHCKQTIAGILKKRQQRKPQAAPTPPQLPKKLSLADLRAAAAARKRSAMAGT